MWRTIRPASRSSNNEIDIEVTTTHVTPGAASEENNDDIEISDISPDKITPGASLQDHLNENYETKMTKKYSFYADFDADNPSSLYQNDNDSKQFHYHMADETNDDQLTPGDDHQTTPGSVKAAFAHAQSKIPTKSGIIGEQAHEEDELFLQQNEGKQTPK
ncbi:MAG: hypothetical protein GY821_08405 [Gammaproteobacteria bacterium]|nr:hypothetical protein [Gammaproteobacteria bacterium]